MFSSFLVQFSTKLNDSMKTTKQKKTKELSLWLTFFLIAVNMYFIIYSPFTVTIQYQMCVVPQMKTVPNKCILLLLPSYYFRKLVFCVYL